MGSEEIKGRGEQRTNNKRKKHELDKEMEKWEKKK